MRKRPLLTRAKAARTKAAIIKGAPLNPPAAVAAKYRARLDRLIDQMTAITRREVEALFARPAAQRHFGQDESIAAAAGRLVSSLEKRFAVLFEPSEELAKTLVNGIDKASSANLHGSLRELSGGLSMKTTVLTGPLKETLTAAAQANAKLIKKLPADYLHDVGQAVLRSVTTGNGLADLLPVLEKREEITRRRAKMIADDQTRKIYAAVNTKRMQALGVKKFIWLHSGGGAHPRELHVKLNGQVCEFDNPPEIDEDGNTGLPGDLPNCKCKMMPVIELDKDGTP